MAIQCKYCGTELPTDDARFCNNCGMLVPSHPFSPQSLSALKSGSRFPFSSSSEGQQEGQKRVLHEQVAELSPARSVQEERSEQDQPHESLVVREEIPAEAEGRGSNELLQKEEPVGELPEASVEKLPETPKPGVSEKCIIIIRGGI